MNIEECYYLGYTSKVHGKQGEVIIKLDVDHPEEYRNLESVLIQMNKKDNLLIPFFISNAVVQNNGTLRIKIEDINTVEEAKALVGKETYLPLNTLPKLTGNKFYYHEIKGFKVFDTNYGEVGIIRKVLDYPTQAILEIENTSEKEILIPITDAIIIDVNRIEQKITVNAPEGLIDLYLQN